MTAANQHLELDGDVLSRQARTLHDAAETLARAGASLARPLDGDAFGALARGILVPSVQALAGRSRELVETARDLAGRMADATDGASTAFARIEDDAVSAFRRSDG